MSGERQSTAFRPHWRLDRRLWAWFSTKTVLLGLLIVFALAMSISYLVPQAPENVRHDPAGYQQWRSGILRQYQGWTPLFELAGLFHVRDSAWFYLLLALVVFALFLAVGSEIGQLWNSDVGSKPRDRIPALSSFVSNAEVSWVADCVRGVLSGLFRTVKQRETDDNAYLLCARRGMWLSYALPVAQIGMLLVVSSVAVNGRWGWEQNQVRLFPSRQVAVGPSGTHQIGVLFEAAGPRLLTQDGHPFALQISRSVRRSGYRYLLVEAGNPLVLLTALSGTGDELTLYDYAVRPEAARTLEFAFSGTEPENERDRLFIVAGDNVVGRLQWLSEPEVPDSAGLSFHLWVFGEDGQTLIGDQKFLAYDHAVSIPIGGVMYTFDVSRYVVVNVAYEPGVWPFRLGIALLIVGIVGSLLPRQRMWVTVRGQDTQTLVDIHDLPEGIAWLYYRRRQRLLNRLDSLMGETCR